MEAREHIQTNLRLLRESLDSGSMRSARLLIHSLHPSELARLLESLPLRQRAVIWEMVEPELEGDVLVEVAEEVRDGLIKGMQAEELLAATDGMELDDLADLVADLPEALTQEVLRSLDKQDQERLRQVLAYDEDSAGGLMNVDIITVRPDVTVEVVLRYLRAHGDIPDGTDTIYVVTRDNKYVASLYLTRLLTQNPDQSVETVMSTDILPMPAHTPTEEVVWEFENRDLLSAPVVDDEYRVVGRITVDDVVCHAGMIRLRGKNLFQNGARILLAGISLVRRRGIGGAQQGERVEDCRLGIVRIPPMELCYRFFVGHHPGEMVHLVCIFV